MVDRREIRILGLPSVVAGFHGGFGVGGGGVGRRIAVVVGGGRIIRGRFIGGRQTGCGAGFSPFLAFAGLGFFGLAFLAGVEPCQPDADFVEHHHWQRHQAEGENVRRGREDGGGHEDRDDGVGPGFRHGVVGEQAEFHQHHDHHRQLEREAEEQRKLGGEGDVFADPPIVGDAEFGAPFVEETERAGQHPVIGEEHPAKEQSETDRQRRPKHLFLMVVESGQDELEDVHQQQRKRHHDPGEERQFHGKHEGFRGAQGGHEPQVAAVVHFRAGGFFQQRGGLFLHVAGIRQRLDERRALGLRQREAGAENGHGFGVETQVVVAEGLEKRVAAAGFQAEHGVFDGLGVLPGVQIERLGRTVFGRRELVDDLGFPNLIHRAAEDFHEALLERETRQHRDQQGDHHPRDHDPQILEVFEERLLVVGVHRVPELENLLEQIHARGGIQAVPERSGKARCADCQNRANPALRERPMCAIFAPK